MSFSVASIEHVDSPRLAMQGKSGGALRRFRQRLAREDWAVQNDWSPQPGYVYSVVRAISARINQNYDGWPAEELKKSHHTFIGKPIFVNHQNEDPSLARGVVVASRYIENGRDKYVEVVQEVDAERFPKLAGEIIEGGMDSVSMGCEAGHTICSACDNKAATDEDLCDCVKYHKGSKVHVAGKGPQLVWEKCGDLRFFELSYVFEPADETAVVSKVLHANKAEGATAPQRKVTQMASRRRAFGEAEAPEAIDTLRPEDSTVDEDFHHYVEAPPELSDPDLSQVNPDKDSGVGSDPGQENPEEAVVEEFVDWCDQMQAPVDYDSADQWAQEVGAAPEELDVIDSFLQQVNPEPDDAEQYPSGINEGSDVSKGLTMASRGLQDRARVASAGRRQHFASDGGYTDDQGEQEEVYLTQVPESEEVAAPARGDAPINNSEQNLVAALQDSTARTQMLAQALQRHRNAFKGGPGGADNDEEYDEAGNIVKKKKKESSRRTAGDADYGDIPEVASVVNPELSGTEVDKGSLVGPFESANPNEDVPTTQPKDASVHTFQTFDRWLAASQNRQRTAGLYTNERFIVGQVKRWAKATGQDPRIMFPVLASVLRDAKRGVEENRRTAAPAESLDVAAPQDRIDVEKPASGAFKVTDVDTADDMGTYNLSDYADNASDAQADPDTSTDLAADLEGWSGSESTVKSSAIKTADAAQAVRLAEAYIKAGALAESDKWEAVAQFQKMRAGQVIDRTHLLDHITANVIVPLKNKVASGNRRGTVSQGIPAGFANGGARTAATFRTAQNDPQFDSDVFL